MDYNSSISFSQTHATYESFLFYYFILTRGFSSICFFFIKKRFTAGVCEASNGKGGAWLFDRYQKSNGFVHHEKVNP